jgi:hypothetical protein
VAGLHVGFASFATAMPEKVIVAVFSMCPGDTTDVGTT